MTRIASCALVFILCFSVTPCSAGDYDSAWEPDECSVFEIYMETWRDGFNDGELYTFARNKIKPLWQREYPFGTWGGDDDIQAGLPSGAIIDDWHRLKDHWRNVSILTEGIMDTGDMAAEVLQSFDQADQRTNYLVRFTDYDSEDIVAGSDFYLVGGERTEVGFVNYTMTGIWDYLRDTDKYPDIVYAGYCWSGQTAQAFRARCILGYTSESEYTLCDLRRVWGTLGCDFDEAGTVFMSPNVSQAMTNQCGSLLTHVSYWQDPDCWLETQGVGYWTTTCINTDVAFYNTSCQGTLEFTAGTWGEAVGFIIQGTDTDEEGRPSSGWRTVASIRAVHGSPISYSAVVPPCAYYRVLCIDVWGRVRGSEVVSRDADYSEEATVRPSSRLGGGTWPYVSRGAIQEWREGRLENLVERDAMEADSSLCADLLVYTSELGYNAGMIDSFMAYMDIYPSLKMRAFVGSVELEDARLACEEVYEANVAYNQETGTDRFPTDLTAKPPLLVILGDSYPLIVDHWWQEGSTYPGCCEGDSCCPADRLVWDLNENGWFGLVHRIPADNAAEVALACQAANEWNDPNSGLTDVNHGVIMTVGDFATSASVLDEPCGVADVAAGHLISCGYGVKPPLIESDYSPWCNDEAKRGALRDQMDDGAVLLWGLGLRTCNVHWPGWFVTFPYPDSLETPQQRMVALQAGCNTGEIGTVDTVNVRPFAEAWLFNNPEQTVIVGSVGHYGAGFYGEHELAQELYLDGWLTSCFNGTEDYALDWVVKYAVVEARNQGLERLEDYFLASGTIGGYVFAHPGSGCPAAGSVGEQPGAGFRMRVMGNPGRIHRVELSGKVGSQVCLEVFDVAGRTLCRLFDGEMVQERMYLTWLGRDRNERDMPSGVYFARIIENGEVRGEVKMLHVK